MISDTQKVKLATRLPYILFLTLFIYFAATPFSMLDYPLDDAWIHRIYSQSFAMGHGFEYNQGQQEAGSTSPLWSIITAPAHWLECLGTDASTIFVKLIGLTLALLSIRAIQKIGETISESKAAGIIAAIVLAIDPRLTFSALSGMEPILLVALWLGTVAFFIERRLLLATLLISLTPTARPEALVILPFFGLAILLTSPRKLWMLTLLPIPTLLWSLFCWFSNGHLLPTTFYMKSKSIMISFSQISTAWNLLGKNGALPSSAVAILIGITTFILIRRIRNSGPLLLLLGAPLAFLFGVLCTREFELSGYYWLRWSDPAILIFTATAAIGLELILTSLKNTKIQTTITLCLLLFTLPHFYVSLTSWRNRLISDSRSINLITIQAGKWINENTPQTAVIAVNDAGATRYFGKRKTIDLMGLNCADIAFNKINPENHASVDFLAITPTWFHGTGLYDGLPVCTNFCIPAKEYTITTNKGQREIVVFKCR